MKTFKKIGKILIIFLLALVTTIGNLMPVNAAPSTIQIGSKRKIEAFVGDRSIDVKTLADGNYIYCISIHRKTPFDMEMSLVGLLDAGYAYLIENGFPNKHFTGNDDHDYYITQIAIWWYMDEAEGTSLLSDSVKSTGPDPYNLRPYIIKLKNEALAAKKKGYVTPSLQLSTNNSKFSLTEDGKYYLSNEISVKANYIGDYKVTLEEAPRDTVILDQEGNARTTFSKNEKFRVRVPVSSIEGFRAQVKLSASATGSVKKAYEYKPADETIQKVLPAVLYPETTPVKDTMTLHIATTKVSILKTDSETGKPLAGATLVLKNDKGEEIYNWVTTGEPYVITDLEYGVYIVEEISAPEGYMKSDEVYMFTLDEENPSYELQVKNYKVIEVPDTNHSSIMMYSIGAVIMLAGIGFVYYYGKKKQEK